MEKTVKINNLCDTQGWNQINQRLQIVVIWKLPISLGVIIKLELLHFSAASVSVCSSIWESSLSFSDTRLMIYLEGSYRVHQLW